MGGWEKRDSLEGVAYVEDSRAVDSPVEGDSIPEAEDSLVHILEEDIHRMPVVVVGVVDNSLPAEILYRCTVPYPSRIDESVDGNRRNTDTKPNGSQ
jgi:hypothetical protein